MECKNTLSRKVRITAILAGSLIAMGANAYVSEGIVPEAVVSEVAVSEVAVSAGSGVGASNAEAQVYCKKVRDSIHVMLKEQCLTLTQWQKWSVQAKPKLEKELAQQAYYANLKSKMRGPFMQHNIGRSKEK